MVARIAVVLVCLLAATALAVWDRDERRCTGAELDLVALGLNGRAPASGGVATARRLDSSCADATPLANAAAALAVRPAERGTALVLGRRAVAREPRTFAAWVGLGAVLQATGDPIRAGAAYGRAQQLNPRWPGRLVAAAP